MLASSGRAELNWRQNLGDRVETAPYKTVVEADEFRIDRAEQNQQLLEPTDIGEVRNRVPRHDHFVAGLLLSSQSWDYWIRKRFFPSRGGHNDPKKQRLCDRGMLVSRVSFHILVLWRRRWKQSATAPKRYPSSYCPRRPCATGRRKRRQGWSSSLSSRPICSRNSTPIGETAAHWML